MTLEESDGVSLGNDRRQWQQANASVVDRHPEPIRQENTTVSREPYASRSGRSIHPGQEARAERSHLVQLPNPNLVWTENQNRVVTNILLQNASASPRGIY